MKKIALAALGCVALGACASAPPPAPPTLTPVCSVLVGPLRYNTYKPDSTRYVPPKSTAILADIKKRNQIGERLHCPAFRARK